MSWVFLSVLAAFLWATTNVIDKYVVSKLVREPLLPAIFLGLAGICAGLLVVFIHGVQSLSTPHLILALSGGFLYMLAGFCYFHAVQRAEVSRAIPLFYIEPLVIGVLSAYFLGEVFGPWTYLGVILLVAGAMLITADEKFKPRFDAPFWLMIIAALSLSVMQVVTKYLLGFADVWTVYAYMRIGGIFVVVPAFVMNAKGFVELYREKGYLPYLCMSASEGLNYSAYLIFTFALSIGYVTLTNALSSVQPFFVLAMMIAMSILFPHIVKEEIGRKTVGLKIFAIAAMFAGALLVG